MIITAGQLVAHGVGDYLLQSHWMATAKTNRTSAAAAHAIAYTVPFAFLTHNPAALAVICATHLLIDRFRLARYVVYAKNFIAPPSQWPKALTATGYDADVPPWLAVWLLIIADNLIHILINAAALAVFR
jgi:hypothetical protein